MNIYSHVRHAIRLRVIKVSLTKYIRKFMEEIIFLLQKYLNMADLKGGVMKIHVDIGRGLEKCPRLSTRRGEGVKNRQNLVHVVIE